MTWAIDTAACAATSIETPAGISEDTWCRTDAGGSGIYIGTVFAAEEQSRAAIRSRRVHDEWRLAVLEKLRSLIQLEEGWDSYGAPAISPLSAECAIRVLAPFVTRAAPSVVPTARGGVQLEWHDGKVDIELECLPSGHAHLFAEDLVSGATEDRWVVPGHPAIDDWLRRISIQG